MKVIIIAAGYGSRLGNLTKNTPKGLLKINGKSILERQINLFHSKKISEINIITGPHKKFGLPDISYINDKNYDEHDVLGSLMAAKNIIHGKIITSYSDILFEEKILDQLLNFKGDIGIPIDLDWKKYYEGRTQHPKSEADNVLLKNNQIIEIKKNIIPKNNSEIIGEFLGPMVFSERGSEIFLKYYEKLEQSIHGKFHNAPSLKKAYLTDMIQELIKKNIHIDPIIIDGNWCEIDTPQDLIRAEKLFN